ncbi:MAG: adenylate kinase [Parachlamydiaceae bacterium]
MKMIFWSLCLCATSFAAVAFADTVQKKKGQTIVILLGPPGSGKGTQAMRLTKELGIPHISTGDLFRENISNNTALGQKAKSYMDAGKLVPDEVVLDMLFDRVTKADCDKGYLLDGFPRTLAQAEALGKHMAAGTELIVLNLEVPDGIIVQRAEGRLTCKACGNTHNTFFSPPTKEGICDKCQSSLTRRPDDKAEIVKERLSIYHSQTKPLIEYYQKKGVLQSVDGTQEPEQVFSSLMLKIRLSV